MTSPKIDFDTTIFGQGRNELAGLRGAVSIAIDQIEQEMAHKMGSLKRRGDRLRRELEDARWRVNNLDENDHGDVEYSELSRAERAFSDYLELQCQADALAGRLRADVWRFGDHARSRIAAAVAEADRVLAQAGVYLAITPDTSLTQGGGHSAKAPDQEVGPAGTDSATLPSGLDALRESCSSDGLPEGYYWLELEALPDSCFVSDPSDFKKFGKEEMAVGVHTLFQHVLPELAQNPHANRITFEEIDRREGTGFFSSGEVRPDSRAEVFEAFLSKRAGADVVVVGNLLADGTVDITSGRHRLGVARELGYPRVPVRIGTRWS